MPNMIRFLFFSFFLYAYFVLTTVCFFMSKTQTLYGSKHLKWHLNRQESNIVFFFNLVHYFMYKTDKTKEKKIHNFVPKSKNISHF